MASARILIAASEASNWPGDGVRIVLDQPDDRSSHLSLRGFSETETLEDQVQLIAHGRRT